MMILRYLHEAIFEYASERGDLFLSNLRLTNIASIAALVSAKIEAYEEEIKQFEKEG